MLRKLDQTRLSTTFKEAGGEFAKLAFESIWLSESERPQGDRRWEEILNICDLLIGYAIEFSLEELAAIGGRIKSVVKGEYQHDLRSAVESCDAVIKNVPGKQSRSIYVGHLGWTPNDLGWRHHQRIISTPSRPRIRTLNSFPSEQYVGSLDGTLSSWEGDDSNTSIVYADRAIVLSKAEYLSTPHLRFRAYAERATLAWLSRRS